MLPQERFAFEYLYKGNRLRITPVSRETDVKSLMESCHLKYRKGKNIGDLREAFWGSGSMSKQSYDSHAEWALERADKVFTIDWASYLKSK